MDAELAVAERPLGRAGRAATRCRATLAEIEPLVALLVDVAALGALLYRHGTSARERTTAGGEA